MKKAIGLALGVMFLTLFLAGCIQQEDSQGQGGGDNMAAEKVEAGNNIEVEYKGTLQDGAMFDSSEGRGPLAFTAGAGQMIKGFDSAVIGMALNEEKTVTLQPGEAYGDSDPGKVVELPKEQVNGINELKVGMSVTSSTGVNGVVKEIKADTVIIDFNHPLAGKTLTFWIKVVKIEK